MHLADTRDQAIDDCTYGLQDFANYFGAAGFVPLSNSVEGTQSPREFVAEYAGQGNCCIGTPGDAIAYIQDLLDTSGGFGTLLLLGHDWASPQATYHSYELFAREVMPHFKGQLTAPRASHDWAKGMRDQLLGRAGEAIVKAINEHTDELQAGQGAVMRASVLRDGRMVLRDDVAEPVPGPGQVLVAVKACGICGSDLHFAAHGDQMVRLTREMTGMPIEGGLRVDLAQDVFMGHEFSARGARIGPDTDAPSPATMVTSLPGPPRRRPRRRPRPPGAVLSDGGGRRHRQLGQLRIWPRTVSLAGAAALAGQAGHPGRPGWAARRQRGLVLRPVGVVLGSEVVVGDVGLLRGLLQGQVVVVDGGDDRGADVAGLRERDDQSEVRAGWSSMSPLTFTGTWTPGRGWNETWKAMRRSPPPRPGARRCR